MTANRFQTRSEATPPNTTGTAGQAVQNARLDLGACWQLLRGTAVGRLAVVLDGRAAIFPVNDIAGRAEEVHDYEALIDVAELPLRPWQGSPKHRHLAEVNPTREALIGSSKIRLLAIRTLSGILSAGPPLRRHLQRWLKVGRDLVVADRQLLVAMAVVTANMSGTSSE